jgi:hypothetical protein
MTPTLWIPRSAARKQLRCTVPGCKSAPFPEDQLEQWRRHVKACAKRNSGEIERQLARREETYFTKSADPEKYAHIRAGGS